MALTCLRCNSPSQRAHSCDYCGAPGWYIRHQTLVEHHPYLDLLPNLVSRRRNPHIPFPIHPAELSFTNYAQRIEAAIRGFVDLDSTVKFSARKDGLSIKTPRSKYRVIVAKKPRWTHDPIRNYYTYVITADYLDPQNVQAMHAVFRILFMGDEYLLPFLQRGPKQLTLPQQKVFDAFRNSYDTGESAGAMILPTGIGKTVLAAKIIHYALKSGGRLLFMAHRTLILDQAIQTIVEENPQFKQKDIGRIFGAAKDKDKQLQKKAVFGTPNSMDKLLDIIPPDHFDFVVIDEFHHGPGRRYRRIIDHMKPHYTLGLTATPYRRDDNDPLAMVRNNVLYNEDEWETQQRLDDGTGFLPSFRLSSALALGYLVTPTIYMERESPYHDEDGEIIPINKLHEYEIEARARKIADKFHEHIGDKQTVVFCASVNEAGYLTKKFNEFGIPSAYMLSRIPGTTKAVKHSVRKKTLQDYRKKKIKVLFTVDIFNEGADVPTIEAAVWLQQSVTMVKILQQLGRGLRLAPGKRELIVLDFVNNIHQVKAFLRYGRTSTGKLEETTISPVIRKVENKDLIQLLIDENQIKIDEEILHLLEREAWHDTDEYSAFFEILCDYGYDDREIVDIINETQKYVSDREPEFTFRPIGTKRIASWAEHKTFLTRPSSPIFRAYFFRDLLKEMGLKGDAVGKAHQNAEDKKRMTRCLKVFSDYMPFGEHYPDILIEKHRHVVAKWTGWDRYRYALAKCMEQHIDRRDLEADDVDLKALAKEIIDNPKMIERTLKTASIQRLFADTNPIDQIINAAQQFLKQTPQYEARNLYAKQRMDLVEISNELEVSYEDVKRWYNNAWEHDKDEHLVLLVKRLLKKRYGLRRGEPGPDPNSTTFGSMIDVVAHEFDEERRDMKELILDLVKQHRQNEIERETAHRDREIRSAELAEATKRKEEARKTEIRQEQFVRMGRVRHCQSCKNQFQGRTTRCKSCRTQLCPNCAKDFCGVCYSKQN